MNKLLSQAEESVTARSQKTLEENVKALGDLSISGVVYEVYAYVAAHGPGHAQAAVGYANRFGGYVVSTASRAYDALTPGQRRFCLVATVCWFAAPIVAGATLNLLGFRGGGVSAGSMAARRQPAAVGANSIFAKAQSVGVTWELGFLARVVVAAGIAWLAIRAQLL